MFLFLLWPPFSVTDVIGALDSPPHFVMLMYIKWCTRTNLLKPHPNTSAEQPPLRTCCYYCLWSDLVVRNSLSSLPFSQICQLTVQLINIFYDHWLLNTCLMGVFILKCFPRSKKVYLVEIRIPRKQYSLCLAAHYSHILVLDLLNIKVQRIIYWEELSYLSFELS